MFFFLIHKIVLLPIRICSEGKGWDRNGGEVCVCVCVEGYHHHSQTTSSYRQRQMNDNDAGALRIEQCVRDY